MLLIVDYGLGNVGSIANMLKRLGHEARISGDVADVARADKLILPGVGAFDNGMESLTRKGLREVLEERVRKNGVPVLGICLGLQLMTRKSEEGSSPGLGWLPAETKAFRGRIDPALRVPHMGWNTVAPTRAGALALPADNRFYFVHSYFVDCEDEGIVCGRTRHGLEFASYLCAGRIVGVQFHPEKSHRYGMALLDSFVRDV